MSGSGIVKDVERLLPEVHGLSGMIKIIFNDVLVM